MRAHRARGPRSLVRRSSRLRREMTRVVHTRDHKSSIALFDDRDRSILDSKREQAVIRPADDSMQSDLDDAAMRHDKDVPVLVAREDRIQLGVDPGLERNCTLPD